MLKLFAKTGSGQRKENVRGKQEAAFRFVLRTPRPPTK
jgi:hypothetical protein